MSTPTIKDVAKRAGVGVGTVSRVVAGKGPVSEKTAKRVRKAIEELKFRPSHAARALQTGQSQTIGVFVPLIKGSFYTPILHAIYTSLLAGGRHMVVVFGQTLENERREALEGAQFLVDKGCDGLLMVATALQQKDIESLMHLKSCLSLLNRSFPRYTDRCFFPDHEAAGAIAARTLWDAGHRRLAVIEGPKLSLDNTLRMRGFFNVLAGHGVDIGGIPRVCGDFSPESGWAGAQEVLSGRNKFTALFCANDEMAMGALSYLQKAGISVPRDLSVMGYDGIDVSMFTAPPLTTVLVPWREIAVNALNHLLNCCYNAGLPVERNLPAQMLWRDSVARIGNAVQTKRSRLASSDVF